MDSSDLKSVLTDATNRLSSPFFCGGSFQSPQPIRLAFKDKDGAGSEMCYMELPTHDDGIVGKLVAACTEASFGIGTETVYNPTYRRSLKLEPNDFLTSFELHSSQILEDIKRVLAPNTDFITAQLYKLNVYRQGDFFKPHVDTPLIDAFASLVLSLPMAFTGGGLVVEHKGHTHCYDWSCGDADGSMMLHWAAFYSDCKHEMEEVTSGFRIVLTYNLYQNGVKNSRDDNEMQIRSWIENSELYNVFCRAKESYEGDGVTLGFPCSHLYSILLHCKNRQRRLAEQLQMLKGEDLLLYSAAQSAGLKPHLCRIWKAPPNYGWCSEGDGYFVDTDFDGIPTPNHGWNYEEEDCNDALSFLGDKSSDIEWCTVTDAENFDWQVGGACGTYGNEPSTEALYCIIAILIDFKEGRAKKRKLEEQIGCTLFAFTKLS